MGKEADKQTKKVFSKTQPVRYIQLIDILSLSNV